MARLFLSHSSADNACALALAQWLQGQGWSDFFLDIDAERGIAPGERWMAALAAAVDRCEAVIFLVSPAWQASKFCFAEFYQARNLGKRLFGVIVRPVELSDLPEQMTAEWQVCDLTAAVEPLQFTVQRPPQLPPTQVVFSGVALAALARGLARAGLAPSSFVWPPEAEPGRAPYPGLRALDEADAAVFFGRDAAIVRAMDQLRLVRDRGVERLFVVLGASGAGKSSFLRAGLLPRLRRDTEHFVVLPALRPERAALSGAQGLLAGLQQALEVAGQATRLHQLRDELAQSGLAAVLQRIEAGPPTAAARPLAARRTVVVPIDQGEELLAADGQAEAQAFLQMMGGMAAASAVRDGVRVLFLMTIRSDSLPRLQGQAGLQALAPVFFSLPAMPVSEFKAVIEGPAQRHSATVKPLSISPELTDELVADAKGSDALPLLALTLEWLYRETTTPDGTRMGHEEYRRLGGVRGVIGKAVERALAHPGQEPAIPADAAEQERLLRQLFPFIASVDPDSGEWKRRVAARPAIRALSPQADALVVRLVEQRLLLADARPLPGAGDGTALAEVVEVAHEALLRQWALLEGWLRAFSADLSNAEALRRAATDWQRSGHDEALLVHTKGRLEAAEALLADVRLAGRFEAIDEQYLAACRGRDRRELQEREAQLQRIAEQQADRARLQRRASAGLVTAAAIVLGFVAWSVWQTQAVSRQTSLVLAGAAEAALAQQAPESAVRLALLASEDSFLHPAHPAALPVLNQAAQANTLRRRFAHRAEGSLPAWSPDGRVVLTVEDGQARVRDVETGAAIGAPIPQPGRFVSATFSPDGARIVIASADKDSKVWQTRVWDAHTGQPLSEALRHDGAVWGLVFNRSGTRVLTILDADHAQVWDAATWTRIGRRVDHDNEILGTRFSPDGQTFATYAKDRRAGLWATETGEPVGAPLLHDGIPQSAEFSPDGRRLVTTAMDNVAHLWDTTSGLPLGPVISSPVRINDARFSPDGRRLALASDNKTTWIVDASSGQSLGGAMDHDSHPKQLAFSADGKRLVTLAEGDAVRTWDAGTGHPLGPALRGGTRLGEVRFSADGSRVLGRSTEAAYAWDALAGAPAAPLIRLASPGSRVQLLGNSRRVLVHAWGDTAQIIDLLSGQAPAPSPQGNTGASSFVGVSPDGAWILEFLTEWEKPFAQGASSTRVRLKDARSGVVRILGDGPQPGIPEHAFSADGTRLLIASPRGLTVWDVPTARPLGPTQPLPPTYLALGFAADGHSVRVLDGRRSKVLHFIDPTTGAPTGPVLEATQPVVTALLSAAGGRVVTVGNEGEVLLWDDAKGQVLRRLRDKAVAAPPPVFSDDGRFILLRGSGPDEPLRVIAAATGIPAFELPSQEPIRGAVLSRDSRFVISWAGKALQVWDIGSGRRVSMPLLHRQPVRSAESSPDGQWLVTLDEDQVVRLWPLPDIGAAQRGAIRARACEALDPALRTVRAEDLRAAPIIEPGRLGDALCARP